MTVIDNSEIVTIWRIYCFYLRKEEGTIYKLNVFVFRQHPVYSTAHLKK